MTKSEELIWEKEKQGIRVTVFTKLGAFAMLLFIQLFFSRSWQETVLSLSIFVPLFLLLIVSVWLLQTGKGVRAAGILSVCLDVALVVLLPVIWYHSDETSGLPWVYILKSLLPVVMLFLLFLNTLSINPLYPLAFALMSTIELIVLYIAAHSDSTVIFTQNFIQYMTTGAINPIAHFCMTALVLLGGGILAYVAMRVRKTIVQSAKLEVNNSQLSRYFSPKVADTITSGDDSFFGLGGKNQEVTVLFSDIRDFTSLSETLKAEQVLELLSEYHQFMVSIIFEYGGTLDKFIGDGIMATFGTPQPGEHDCLQAVKAAVAMRKALDDFNTKREAASLPVIRHGIGIHTGPAIVGNIGIKDRLEYTVIGDTVNTASRVETACKETGEDILISATTAERVGGLFSLKTMGRLALKGKAAAFELFGVDSPLVKTGESV